MCALVAGCTLDRSGLVDPMEPDAGDREDAQIADSGRDAGRDAEIDNDAGPIGTIVGVAAGEAFSCALRSDGEVRCWGNNGEGQLGDGTQTARATSEPVLISMPATQIAL